MNWLLLMGFVVAGKLIADIFAKEWSLKSGALFAIIALGMYLLTNIIWLFALKNGSGLARGVIIFSLATETFALLIGFLYYHESITKTQSIGIILGFISLVLIIWE